MSKARNEGLESRIIYGISLMDYKKGTPLIKEKVLRDINYLIYKKKLDLSDVKKWTSTADKTETITNACEFALQTLLKLGYVKQTAIDTSIFEKERPSRQQFVLLIDSKDIPREHFLGWDLCKDPKHIIPIIGLRESLRERGQYPKEGQV